METTIVAIATPIGVGGVGVIRLSGPKSLDLLKKIFIPTKAQEYVPRKMVFGNVSFSGIIDDCLAVWFKAPNSFTGEDVVEIQMHGGVKLLEETVKKLLEVGATMAMPGEFSKRAVMNGKMDITQAEGLIDIIYADSIKEMQVASSQMRGDLYDKIKEIQNEIKDQIAHIEVALDFPEHEETFAEEKLKQELPQTIQKLQTLVNTSQVGTKIKNGVNVCLVGEPNVGKSSVLNALVGFDRAIVTSIAGTTRDTINEGYAYKNIKFNVTDTAGLRESDDIVEKEGIKRSLKSIENSDFVIFLFDNAKKHTESDKFSTHNAQNFAKVLNKIDLKSQNNTKNFDLCISAKESVGIEELKELIYQKTINQTLLSEKIIITNLRHEKLLKEAIDNLKKALKDLNVVSLDCISVPILRAWELLGEITGETANDSIIDAIFSKFCLGK